MTPAKPGSWPKQPFDRVRDKDGPAVVGALHEPLPSSPWEVKLVLLDPPGWHRLWSQGLSHWPPYVQSVDQALADRSVHAGFERALVDAPVDNVQQDEMRCGGDLLHECPLEGVSVLDDDSSAIRVFPTLLLRICRIATTLQAATNRAASSGSLNPCSSWPTRGRKATRVTLLMLQDVERLELLVQIFTPSTSGGRLCSCRMHAVRGVLGVRALARSVWSEARLAAAVPVSAAP